MIEELADKHSLGNFRAFAKNRGLIASAMFMIRIEEGAFETSPAYVFVKLKEIDGFGKYLHCITKHGDQEYVSVLVSQDEDFDWISLIKGECDSRTEMVNRICNTWRLDLIEAEDELHIDNESGTITWSGIRIPYRENDEDGTIAYVDPFFGRVHHLDMETRGSAETIRHALDNSHPGMPN